MVKNLLFVCILTYIFHFNSLFGQVPQGINYQGIARDASGQALKGVSVTLLFELYDNISGGNLVFNETTSKTTDVQTGIFTHVIGSVNSSGFTGIAWATGSKYLQVSVNGTVTGRQQLMSVPYALYAANSGNTYTPSLILNGNNLAINGGNTVTLPTGTTYTPGGGINISGNTISSIAQTLSINQNSLSISGGNTVVFPVPTTIAVPSNSLLSSTNTGNNYTLTVSPQVFTQAGNTFSSNYGGSITVPSATTLIAPTVLTVNAPHTATNTSALSGTTVNLNINAVDGSGATGFVPVWTNTNTLANSNSFQNANGALIVGVNNVAGSAPLIVRNFNGGNGLTIHQGSNTATGLAFNTNITNPHSIGTIDAQTLGFFTGNTNTTSNFPLSVKSNNEVEIGQSLNFRNLISVPPTSSANEGRIYFNGTKFRVSENGSAFFDLINPSPWTKSGVAVTLATTSDNVGIGVTPTSKFEVLGQSKLTSNTGADALFVTHTGISGSAGTFSSTNGSALNATSSSTVNATIQSLNSSSVATAYAGFFDGGLKIRSKSGGVNTNALRIDNSSANEIFNVTENGFVGIKDATPSSAIDIFGLGTATNIILANTSPETAIQILNNDLTANNHSSIIFKTQIVGSTISESAKIVAQNVSHSPATQSADLVFLTREPANIFERMRILGNGNVGIGVANPGYQLAVVNSNGLNAAVYGSQQLSSLSNNAHGVYGTTSNSSTLAAGVYGNNTGAGPSIFAEKTVGAGAALRAETQTTNAAIHAVTGTSTLSALALLVENGHIKVIGPATTSATLAVNNSGGFSAPTAISVTGNDVRGNVSFQTGATGFSPTNNFCRVKVKFARNYASIPIVVLTPTSTMYGLEFNVLPAVDGFIVTILKPDNMPQPSTVPSSNFSFSYIVIE